MADDRTTFTAEATQDGRVTITVDAQTALQLAAAWDHLHLEIDVNAILHPLWWWDAAALRRAAADAVTLDYAHTETPRRLRSIPGGAA